MEKARIKICFQLFKTQTADQVILCLGTQENRYFMSVRRVEVGKGPVGFFSGVPEMFFFLIWIFVT